MAEPIVGSESTCPALKMLTVSKGNLQPWRSKMIYRLVQLVENQWVITDFTDETVAAAMEVRGFAFDKIEQRSCLRPELRGKPKFKGVCGPMWGGIENGKPVIRYEDWKVYDRLSA